MQTYMGFDIHVSPDPYRYQLPADVPPPPGMTRGEFNAWARDFLGTNLKGNLIADGQFVMMQADRKIYMNPRTYMLWLADLRRRGINNVPGFSVEGV